MAHEVTQLVLAGAAWPSSVQQADNMLAAKYHSQEQRLQQQRQQAAAAAGKDEAGSSSSDDELELLQGRASGSSSRGASGSDDSSWEDLEAVPEEQVRAGLQQVEVPAEEREEARQSAAMFAQQAAFDLPGYLQHLRAARHKQRELEAQLRQLPEASKAVRAAYAARRYMLLDERILKALTSAERRKVEAAAAAALKAAQLRALGEDELLPAAEIAAVAKRCGADEGMVQQCLVRYVRFRAQARQWRDWSQQLAQGVMTRPPAMPRSAAGVTSLPAELMGAMPQEGQQEYDPLASLMPGMQGGMQGLADGALGGEDEDVTGQQMRAASVRLLEERKVAQAHSMGRKVRRPAWGKARKGQ